MLKKLTLFLLLNASLFLGFVSLKNDESRESSRNLQKSMERAVLALENYPHEELNSSFLTHENVRELKDWHEQYAKDLKLPLRWRAHFKNAQEHESFASSESDQLLNKLKASAKNMHSLTFQQSWTELHYESKEMMRLLDSQHLFLENGPFAEHLKNYVSFVLNSKLSTENKELALMKASDVETALIDYQAIQDDLKLEQTWLKTFLSLPPELNSKSDDLIIERQSNFYFWGQAFLYLLFFALNFLLLWDWGRAPRRSLRQSNKANSTALEGLLCSRKAVEKSLVKCQEILQGRRPNFKMREWHSQNVLFTNPMRDSLAEVFAEIASHKELKTQLYLCAGDAQDERVACRIKCSNLQAGSLSLIEPLSSRMKQLAKDLTEYKGDLDWECLYNESGPYELCLTVEFPRAPV